MSYFLNVKSLLTYEIHIYIKYYVSRGSQMLK